MHKGVSPEDYQVYANYLAGTGQGAPPTQGYLSGGLVRSLMNPAAMYFGTLDPLTLLSLADPQMVEGENPLNPPGIPGSPMNSLDINEMVPQPSETLVGPPEIGESVVNYLKRTRFGNNGGMVQGYARGGQVESISDLIRMIEEDEKRRLEAQRALAIVSPEKRSQLPQLAYPTAAPEVPKPSLDATAAPTGDAYYDAYMHYISKGLSHNAAAGIVGNLYVESAGFDPRVLSGARRGDNGKSAFAAQWQGKRLTNLYKFSGTETPTLPQQLDFVLAEMDPKSPYRDPIAAKYRSRILNAGTPEESALMFRKKFERAGTPHDSRRIAAAKRLANYRPAASSQQAVAPRFPDPGPNIAFRQPERMNIVDNKVGLRYPSAPPATPSASTYRGRYAEVPPDPNYQTGSQRAAKWRPTGNYVARGTEKVDPRLRNLMKTASETYEGPYIVEPFSGWRPGKGGSQHKGHVGRAIDVRLIDPKTGRALPNYQAPEYFNDYFNYAQHVYRTAQNIDPNLAKELRWGGLFGPAHDKKGNPTHNVYGSMDLMHFDLGGGHRMVAGNLEKGLHPKYAKFWGINQSAKMASNPPVKVTGNPPIKTASNKPAPALDIKTPTMMAGVSPTKIVKKAPSAVPPPAIKTAGAPSVGKGIGSLFSGLASGLMAARANAQPAIPTEVYQHVRRETGPVPQDIALGKISPTGDYQIDGRVAGIGRNEDEEYSLIQLLEMLG